MAIEKVIEAFTNKQDGNAPSEASGGEVIKEIPDAIEEPKDKTKKDLEKVAKDSEKVAKSIEELTKAKVDDKGKKFQAGGNIRIDDNGKLIVRSTSTVQGTDRNRLPLNLQTYVLGLRGLQQMAIEAQEKLNRNEPLSSAELETIKKAKTKLESVPQLAPSGKADENKEFKSVVLAGKAISRSAERKAKESGDEKNFDRELEKNISELNLEAIGSDEDTSSSPESDKALNALKEKFGKILISEDPNFPDTFFRRKEFAYIRRALEKGVITVDDIEEEDLIKIREESQKTIPEQEEVVLLKTGEPGQPPSHEDVQKDSEAKLEMLDEILFSYKGSAIKARQELLGEAMEVLTVSLTPTDILTDEEIEDIFKLYRLTLPSDADLATTRNLQEARYQMEAYKDYFRRRNEKASRFITAEYEGFKSGITQINKSRSEKGQEPLVIDFVDTSSKEEPIETDTEQAEKPVLTVNDQSKMYEQYSIASEELSPEELEILRREKESAIIKTIIDDITTDVAPEKNRDFGTFRRNIENLLLLGREGDAQREVDRSRVSLSTEEGYYCLTFSDEALLVYALDIMPEDLETYEEEVVDESTGQSTNRLNVRFKDGVSDASQGRTAAIIEGAASKELNYVMTYEYSGKQETINHEVRHKQKEEYNSIRIEQNNQFIAYKIADAFYKHLRPVRIESGDKVADELALERHIATVKSLAQKIAEEFKKPGTTNEHIRQIIEKHTLGERVEGQIIEEKIDTNDEDVDKNKKYSDEELFNMKLKALVEYREKYERKLLENNLFKRSEKVEELVTQMQNHFSGDRDDGQPELLTLSSLGFQPGEYSPEHTDPSPDIQRSRRGNLNENAVESLAIIRLLNELVTSNKNITKSMISSWSNRLIKYEQFDSLTTLEFIYDLIDHDSRLGLILPDSNQNPEKDNQASDYCDATKDIYDNKIESYAVKRLRIQAEKEGWTDEQYQAELKGIKDKISRTYGIHRSLLQRKNGLEPTPEEQGTGRKVSTEKYDLSEAVDLRTQVGLLAKEDYVRYSFQKLETPIVGTIPVIGGFISKFLSESGLKPRDLAELGITKDVRQINRNRLLPFGLEFTSLGKRLQNTRLFYKESDKARRERLGIDNLYGLEMKSLYDVFWREVIDGMTAHAQIQQNHSYLLASDRIGVIHFDGDGGQPGVYSKLEDIDKYYDGNLYAEISRNGGRMRQSLIARGFKESEIDNLLKGAFNPNQTLNGGNLPTGMQLRLGSVTDYWAELTKQFRIKSVYVSKDELERGTNEDFIEQGRTFDKISRVIMEAQVKAHNEGKTFTLRNVIDAINSVEAIKPGDGDLETWKKQRRFVKVNGQNLPLQDVKDYIQAYFLARTYEATATGVYGEREVVTIGGRAYEIIPGYQDVDDNQKKQFIDYIRQRNDPSNLLVQADLTNLANLKNQALQDYNNALALASTITPTGTNQLDILAAQDHVSRALAAKERAEANYNQYKAELNPAYLIRQLSPQGITLMEITPDTLPETVRNEIFNISAPGIYTVNNLANIRTFKDLDTSIILRSSQGVGARKIKPFEGINKSTQLDCYGEIKQHTPGNRNDRSLKDRSGLMTNAIQDVVVERTKVLELYFYHQTMIKAAAQYKSEASRQKEKWVGFARLDQIARWTITAGVLASIFGGFGNPEMAQLMSKLFLNPTTVGLLLADYFFISNKITQIADMWSKRKVNAIKSESELYNQETAFEQALSNPRFNSTRGRLRLAAAVKGAEDILKQSALALDHVDVPDNRLQNVTNVVGDTAKSVYS